MLMLNEHDDAVWLKDLFTPIVNTHFWVLDLEKRDYMLTEIQILEEITCPTLVVDINGYRFAVPAAWHILVYDPETMQLDCVSLSDSAGKGFTAFVFGKNESMPIPYKLNVVGYVPSQVHVVPSFNKHQMICHPIGPDLWVNFSSGDVYNRYLRHLSVGDIT